jgi:signal transduction histidine kinase
MTTAQDASGAPKQPARFQRPWTERSVSAHRSAVPGLRWCLALSCALLVVSTVLVLSPFIPVALPNSSLSVGLATLAATVGLALLQLGLLRFYAFGRLLDLFAGLAFGTLALANLVVRVLGPAAALQPAHSETTLLLIFFARMVATTLFFAGLARLDKVVVPGQRRRFGVAGGAAVAAGLSLGAAALIGAGDRLPRALDPSARQLLEEGALIPDALPGQAPWLVLADSVLALLLVLVTVGYSRASWRLGDLHMASLGVALTLLSVAQFHTVLFPPVDLDYVSTSDGFRLAAYAGLLASLVQRLGRELAERACHEERLRLSRELHDGLAQQLTLLHLRLNQAAAADRPAEARAHDFAAARRLVEAALLEARQAITVLRSGTVSWEEFGRTVAALASDFASNHDVDVQVRAEGAAPQVEAELQLDILRLAQEALSNAVRHGAATRIEVALTATPGRLEVAIRDNGRGFEPSRAVASRGVGLSSMAERVRRWAGQVSVDSAPGQGAAVRVWVPVGGRREGRS